MILCVINIALFLQFFADADDVDAWMMDTYRLVSSEDVGKDEDSVQSLLKKHKVRGQCTVTTEETQGNLY